LSIGRLRETAPRTGAAPAPAGGQGGQGGLAPLGEILAPSYDFIISKEELMSMLYSHYKL